MNTLISNPSHNGTSAAQPFTQYPSPELASITQPPAPQPELWANIPAELRERPQWCLASDSKRPITINGGAASSTDPSSWADFDSVIRTARQKGLHIGYMIHEDDPFACIDLDVKDSTPQDQIDRFWSIVKAFDSYTERSRSGRGLHVWVRGEIGQGCKRDGVELYSQERFIITTGDTLQNNPIERRQEMLINMAEQMRQAQGTAEPLPDEDEVEGDDTILQRARSAENASKFIAHYEGDFNAIGDDDHSRVDMVLVQMLAHYTRNNAQLKRLFLGSALGQRAKARQRKDYLDGTIRHARSNQAEDANKFAHGESIAKVFVENYEKAKQSKQSKFRIYSESEVLARPPVRWRVHGLIPQEGLGAIFGQPACGKSFLAIDLLAAIANGREWFGRTTRPSSVVYIALEGRGGISQRLRAYNACKGRSNIHFMDMPLDLRDKQDRKCLIEAVTDKHLQGGIVCIDTLAASAPGMDENTSADMGMVIAGMQEVQGALGGCVLFVHHAGKSSERGLRGWSGLTGAVDFSIEVSAKEKLRTWRVAKSKDGEGGIECNFMLVPVNVGTDEEGFAITSCVIDTQSTWNFESSLKVDEVTGGEDENYIFNFIKNAQDSGQKLSAARLESEIKPHRSITQKRFRGAIKRLRDSCRIVQEGTGNSAWLRATCTEVS
ncbi:AAA family ATPase [Pseudomonas sp. LB3P81]